jgi:hypothetical protein
MEGARDVVEERMRFEPRRDRDVCFQRTPQRAWRDLGSDRARPTHEAFGSN